MIRPNKKTIFLVPRLDNQGGVANYYCSIKPYLGENVTFLSRGKDGKNSKFFRLISDYYEYIRTVCRDKDSDAVVINHSLGPGSFFRDGIYSILTPKRYKKIVYFRGWNPEFEKKVDKSFFFKKWLEKTFLKADHIIVLSFEFKAKLKEWGCKGPVSLGSTIVDESLIQGIDLESLSSERQATQGINILYLGNVSKAKGVCEVLKAYDLLRSHNGLENLKCIMAGEGQELEALKNQSRDNDLGIEFPGYVREKEKIEAFKNAHIYVFPSIHGEGMPTSVLEAMAFGLPVITTRVGGIPDFFEDGKMGLFLDSREPEHIAEKIRYLLERPELMQQMSKYNFEYAKEHFYASKVAKWFMDVVESAIDNRNS